MGRMRLKLEYRNLHLPLLFKVLTGLALFVIVFSNSLPVWSIERGEELAGDHDKITPALTAPGSQEPERDQAGANQDRPTLKLPDVIVKGDRQYRVTAERRDLLLMDPMWGTKEMPADLGKVVLPGLGSEKDAPAADTVTAKNYLFSLEAGGGSSRLSEVRLIAGYEFDDANCILRADYSAGDHPLAYGIRPFDQQGSANLDVGMTAIPGMRLSLGIVGKGETNRQPEDRVQGWGDWLERVLGKIKFRSEFEISNHSKISVAGGLGNFYQHGIISVNRPILKSRFADLFAEFEQDIQGVMPEDLNLLVRFNVISQEAILTANTQHWQEQEYLQNLLARFRFRPVSALHIDIGVRLDEFHGIKDKNSSEIIGQASLVLPTGTIFYGNMNAGLEWQLVSEWSFDHPRQSIFWLPEPETVLKSYRVGWRQRFSEQVSTNVAWFRREMRDVPVWLDGDGDGLFTLINLSEGSIEGTQLEIEIQYTKHLFQILRYVYHEVAAGPVLKLPNIPRHEVKSEFRLELAGTSIAFYYHYLGERYGDSAEVFPSLKPAHLLGTDCDIKLSSYFNIFVRLDNMLGFTWDEWQGYAGRNFNALAGARITF